MWDTLFEGTVWIFMLDFASFFAIYFYLFLFVFLRVALGGNQGAGAARRIRGSAF